VVAINTATYWHALRTMGVQDKRDGFGALMREH
jgi:maleate isomerase